MQSTVNIESTSLHFNQRAEIYLSQGKVEDAIAACEQALKVKPDFAPALKTLGNALQAQGRIEEARHWYAKAIEIQPDFAEAYANLGSIYASQQKWSEAISHYQKAIALKPNFAGVYRNLAKLFSQIGKTAESQDYWYQAFTLEPEKATAEEHLNLGNSLLQQAKLQEAVNCYGRAIKLNPNLALAYQNLGEALKQAGNLEQAAPYYRKAIELNAINGKNASQSVDTLPSASQGVDTLPSASQGVDTLPSARQTNGTVKSRAAAPSINNIEDAEAYNILADGYLAQGKFPQAIAACRRSLQMKPDAAIYKILGNALQATGKLEDAKNCYIKALELNPNFAEAYANLGSLYGGQEQWQQAIAAYKKAIAIKPDFAGAYRNFAKLWAQVGKPVEAAECWYQAFNLDPSKATADEYLSLAKTFLEQGKVDEGIACYRRALELNPDHSWGFHELGEILKEQGKWEDAIPFYRRAIEFNPDHSWSHNNLADALMKLERWEEAADAYLKAIELNPDHSWSHNNLGDALVKLERWEEAADAYIGANKVNPDFFWSQNNLGDVLVKLERWEEAAAAYRRAMELNADHFGSHSNLAEALVKLEDWDEAVLAYRSAIELNPDFFWSQNNLGDVLIEQERWEEAIPVYRRALELNPDFAWAHYNLGQALEHEEEWNEAIASYRRAAEIQPDLPWLPQKLADALRKRAQGDLEAASKLYREAIAQNPDDVQLYHKALEIAPNDADLYVGLADALVRHNWWDGAIVFYQMALQIKPDDRVIAARLEKVLEKKKGVSKAVLAEDKPSSLLEPSASDRNARAALDYQKPKRQLEQENPFDSKVKEINSSTPLPVENSYERWQKQNIPTEEDLRQMSKMTQTLEYQPVFSILLPIYNPAENLLREAIESAINQVYPYWELSIVDNDSTVPHIKPILEEYAAKDTRIKLVFRSENNLNSAFDSVTGEFIILLDDNDVLAKEALYEVVSLLNRHPEADLIYSDEDKIDEKGKLTDPFFKPDWCPDSFLSRMYISRLATYRRALVDEVGGFRSGYEGSHDYDLALRLTEKTNKIFHIPKILYHCRIGDSAIATNSSKKNNEKNAKKALEDALRRRGEKFSNIISVPDFPGAHIIRYHIDDFKLVSIIIPTRNLGNFLDRCLTSIFEKTTYPNYEVIVIDNGSDEPETALVFAKWKRKEPTRFKCYELDIPFNFSRINNYAVAQAQGDYILFLNNDTEVISSDWIEAMVEQVQKPTIGAVGAKLLYPDNTIQHAGVVLGLRSIADHSHRNFAATDSGYYGQIATVNNYSAVTGACLMCRREVFEKIGGFDEQLAVAFNDVDLCLEMIRGGYRNVYLPHVVLYHYESKSRGIEDTSEKQRRFMQEHENMKQRWKEIIDCDPCYNINLTRTRDDYSLRVSSNFKIDVYKPLQLSKLLLASAVDSPKAGIQLNASTIYFGGWVIGKMSPATKIELISCSQTIREIPVGLPRPDVGEVHKNSAWSENSGFWAEVELIEIPRDAELLLQVWLEDGSQFPLAVVCFKESVEKQKVGKWRNIPERGNK